MPFFFWRLDPKRKKRHISGQLVSKGLYKFAFAPKNEQKYFCTSALAYKKRSNQKSIVRELKSNSPIKVPLFFWFDLVLEATEEIQNIFVWFFGANEKFEKVLSKLTDL